MPRGKHDEKRADKPRTALEEVEEEVREAEAEDVAGDEGGDRAGKSGRGGAADALTTNTAAQERSEGEQ